MASETSGSRRRVDVRFRFDCLCGDARQCRYRSCRQARAGRARSRNLDVRERDNLISRQRFCANLPARIRDSDAHVPLGWMLVFVGCFCLYRSVPVDDDEASRSAIGLSRQSGCGRICHYPLERGAGSARCHLFADAPAQTCFRIFAIQFRDEAGADLRRANRLAFVRVGAIPKAFGVHRAHHTDNAFGSFGIALW
jgi:hypothetical protein